LTPRQPQLLGQKGDQRFVRAPFDGRRGDGDPQQISASPGDRATLRARSNLYPQPHYVAASPGPGLKSGNPLDRSAASHYPAQALARARCPLARSLVSPDWLEHQSPIGNLDRLGQATDPIERVIVDASPQPQLSQPTHRRSDDNFLDVSHLPTIRIGLEENAEGAITVVRVQRRGQLGCLWSAGEVSR